MAKTKPPTKEAPITAEKPALTGLEQINSTINAIRGLWGKGKEARLELGKLFSQLRAQTLPYERGSTDGKSYTQAVAETGVPRGTAEGYRNMYEVLQAAKIPADTYLILADHGCDLAAERVATLAGIVHDVPELLTIDVTDEEAVKRMAKKIKDGYPVERKQKSAPTPLETLAEVLASIEEMPESAQTDKMREDTQKAIVKMKVETLLSLATAVAPFVGRDAAWAETWVNEVEDNSALLDQRYNDAVTFAKSASFLTEPDMPYNTVPDAEPDTKTGGHS
jgi:hypothetical protein